MEKWRLRVDELLYDYANPPAAFGTGDGRFPRNGRHKDWYDGHSWATGLVAYETGKSQESSSEAAHGYLAVALLGAARKDDALRDWGRLLFATEVRGARAYWQMADGGPGEEPVYAPAFGANRMAGGVAGFAAVAATWFGSNPEYVHGINVLPVVPGLTDALFDEGYACSEAPILMDALAREEPAPPVEASWRGVALADLAVVDADGAWDAAVELDASKFDDGASKANLLLWIATRRAERRATRAPAPACDLAAANVTSLPWETADVDVECAANLACVAMALTGSCCPQEESNYMFGCCPVLKRADPPPAPAA